MPWFITAIATEKNSIENPFLEWKTKRTFGFYNTYNEACEAAKENRGDMHECLYNYLVFEYIEPGIHPAIHITNWWVWAGDWWRRLPESQNPKELSRITNWALG